MKKCCYHVLYLGRTWQLTAQKNAHASAILPTFTWRHRDKVGQRPASHSQPTVLIMVSFECIRHTVSAFNLITSAISTCTSFLPTKCSCLQCQLSNYSSSEPHPSAHEVHLITWDYVTIKMSGNHKGTHLPGVVYLTQGGSYGWTNTWFLLEICPKKQALTKFEVFDGMDIIVVLLTYQVPLQRMFDTAHFGKDRSVWPCILAKLGPSHIIRPVHQAVSMKKFPSPCGFTNPKPTKNFSKTHLLQTWGLIFDWIFGWVAGSFLYSNR